MTTATVVADLAARGVPDDDRALVSRLDDTARRHEGVPTDDDLERRRRAGALVASVAGDAATVDAVGGPLGIGWCSDLDLPRAVAPDDGVMTAAGWLRLDGLVTAVGSRGTDQWAVVCDDDVVMRLDVCDDVATGDAAVAERISARAERLGRARLREVLEARALARRGVSLPARPGTAVIVERDHALGGSLPRVTHHRPRARFANQLSGARLVRRLRRRRVVLALSGTDGAGKSTTAAHVSERLGRLGIPTATVWTRPGMRPGVLAVAARLVKRATGQPSEPGIRAVGRGDDAALASRRGVVGWVWTLLVTASFLLDVWRHTLGTHGVVIYDRHVIDARVTLDVVYRGVDVRVAKALSTKLLPRATTTVLLDVPPEVARARKPDDLFEVEVLADQVERCRREAARRGAHVIDATRPPAEVGHAVLCALIGDLA